MTPPTSTSTSARESATAPGSAAASAPALTMPTSAPHPMTATAPTPPASAVSATPAHSVAPAAQSSQENPSAQPAAASSDPLITGGICYALFAYDIGLGIDLERAAPLVREMTQREAVKHPRPTPRYFDFKPAPLRVIQSGPPITIGGFTTAPRIEAVIFDFGAVSITYHIPLKGPLSSLLAISSELYENPVLLEDSRRRVAALLDAIHSAVQRPLIADFVEDYSIFHIAAIDPASLPPSTPSEGSQSVSPAASIISTNRQRLAQILRSEMQPLSAQEVDDALASRIAYSPGEEAIIDWNAAICFQKDIDDIRSILEYANVELLELRWLDDQLDQTLDRSFEALGRRAETWSQRMRRSFPLIPDREIRRIARHQMDSALLFEGVNNALKLIGDQYLARVYRLAAQRMRLPEWDTSILRKLQTAESVYQKLSDQAATRRLEVLEWIIIILIAVSVLLMLK